MKMKYFLRGFGAGIVAAALILCVYYRQKTPEQTNIVQQAKELGMVFPEGTKAPEPTLAPEPTATPELTKKTEVSVTPQPTEKPKQTTAPDAADGTKKPESSVPETDIQIPTFLKNPRR